MSPSTLSCLACGSVGRFAEKLRVKGIVEEHRLMICGECGSGMFDPLPTLDYSTHTASEQSIRDYVELNAAVDLLASGLVRVSKGRPKGRMLDIGCGYGFAADALRRLEGWDVVGFEPSTYGSRGAEALGLQIYREYLTEDHAVARERFDIVHLSEVIEHIEQPEAFLRFLSGLLNSNGILVLSTPDISALDEDITEAEKMAVMTPGGHCVLFSRKALDQMMRKLGFENVVIERRGTSHVVYATSGDLHLSPVEPIRVGIAYVNAVLQDDAVKDENLIAGLRFRLFRYLVDLGDYEEASKHVASIEEYLIYRGASQNISEFYQSHRVFLAILFYYHAMYSLNHLGDAETASKNFMMSYLLCKQKIRLLPSRAVVHSDIVWRALFHAALAAERTGQIEEAEWLLTRLLRPPSPGMPPVPRALAARARELQISLSHKSADEAGGGSLPLRIVRAVEHALRRTAG